MWVISGIILHSVFKALVLKVFLFFLISYLFVYWFICLVSYLF